MRRISLAVAAGLVVAGPSAGAQQPAPAAQPAPVDPRAVVAEARRVIAERYVLPERRPALDAVLAEGLSSGRYDVREPAALAERINADLERVGRDRHLGISYDPRRAAMMSAVRRTEAPDRSGYERQVRSRNHGVTELKVLPGNIRYLNYQGFDWIGTESAAALETAMRFLSGGDAVIIDLRNNGGGSPDAVQYIISHFMEANRPLVTFHMNGEPTPNTLSSLAEVPAGRMLGKPLYVLISGGTASAAEEFTGHVGGYRLGELVGETTSGAGFRNELVPIEGGFMLSVSVGRAVLASTGRDWEAVGHSPTIRSDVGRALDVAQAHALRRLAATAPEQDRARFEGIAEALAARAEPRPPALPLAAYAGSFGERSVRLDQGRLYYQLGERPRRLLVPLGGNVFAFDDDPTIRLAFAANGTATTSLEIAPVGAPPQGRYERTGS
ncbi:S41 family peptidase [Allosphingosinicella sp.]|jgi:hypothetical protein|uniref:S41 family peptidase n=1 Tax=Allosphingosinicella sp. TaxID=2823234 RepID=UPI002F08F721